MTGTWIRFGAAGAAALVVCSGAFGRGSKGGERTVWNCDGDRVSGANLSGCSSDNERSLKSAW